MRRFAGRVLRPFACRRDAVPAAQVSGGQEPCITLAGEVKQGLQRDRGRSCASSMGIAGNTSSRRSRSREHVLHVRKPVAALPLRQAQADHIQSRRQVQDLERRVQYHLSVEVAVLVQDTDTYCLRPTAADRDLRNHLKHAGVVKSDGSPPNEACRRPSPALRHDFGGGAAVSYGTVHPRDSSHTCRGGTDLKQQTTARP
jgi:hypothetical protein